MRGPAASDDRACIHPRQARCPPRPPSPPDVRVDHSGGLRAIATNHSVRRYVERSLGIGEEALAGLDDAAAVEALHAAGYHVQAYRDRLAYFGGVQLRYRADGVVIDGNLVHKTTVTPDADGEEQAYTQVRVTAKGLAKLAAAFAPRLPGV